MLDLSICYRYVDVFDMERYVRETNITLELGTASFGDDIRKIQRTVTVFDIFEVSALSMSLFINVCSLIDPVFVI